MKHRPSIVFLLILLLSPNLLAKEPSPAVVDPKAEKIIRKMCDYFQSLKSFEGRHVSYLSNWSGATPVENVQFAALRPNMLIIKPDDTNSPSLTCDGTNTYEYTPSYHKLYYVSKAPPTLEGITNGKPGILLHTMIITNRYKYIMSGFFTGMNSLKYINQEKFGGINCDHLRMEQANRYETNGEPTLIDLWIAAGSRPALLKMMAQFTGETFDFKTGEVKEHAVQSMIEFIEDWKANSSIAKERFIFTPPAGSQRVNPEDKTIVIKEDDGTVLTIDRTTGSVRANFPPMELKPDDTQKQPSPTHKKKRKKHAKVATPASN